MSALFNFSSFVVVLLLTICKLIVHGLSPVHLVLVIEGHAIVTHLRDAPFEGS